MSKDRNVCSFTGRVTKDPELKVVGESSVVNFSVAVNSTWKKDGEKHEKTTFVDFDAWNGQAKFISEYVKKGDYVLVDGEYRRDKVGDNYFHGFRVKDFQKLNWTAADKSEGVKADKPSKTRKAKVEEVDDSELPF